MKKRTLLIAILGIFLSPAARAQVPNDNFVRVEVPQVALTDTARLSAASPEEVLRSETLYDGLGRPVQTVQIAAAPTKKDLCSGTPPTTWPVAK